MKMKKVVGIILVFCLCVGMTFGCGSTKESDTMNTTGDAMTDDTMTEGTEPASTEKVKLTAIFIKHPLTIPLADMKWLQEAEDRAGVEIEWQEVTADWAQQKGALLASGDVPDLIVGPNAISDGEFAQFPGLFADLTDLIQQYAPNVQKMFEDKPETKVISTQLDGKIYGIAKYQRYWPDTVTRQYINQQWLDNLGLEVPTNWDELFDVLMAFKTEDANGNGDKDDEIPFDWCPNDTVALGVFMPTVLLGSTGMTLTDTSQRGYFVEDGVVKNFFVDERYKQVMTFLNKCYSAGLVDTEVFTHDYSAYQSVARGEGDMAKVGYTYGWEISDRVGLTLAPQYSAMGPLKVSADATVDLSWDYSYNMLNYNMNAVQVAESCENKEAAMKFINELYNPEVSMQVLFGSIGTNIADNGDGTYSVLPPADTAMDPGTWKWTSSMADNGPMYISDDLQLTLGTDMQAVAAQTEQISAALSKIDLTKNVLPSMFMKYSDEDNVILTLNNTNLMNLTLAKWAQWTTNGGIDAEWDAYVKDCNATGLPQNLEIMQKYYDEYMSK